MSVFIKKEGLSLYVRSTVNQYNYSSRVENKMLNQKNGMFRFIDFENINIGFALN